MRHRAADFVPDSKLSLKDASGLAEALRSHVHGEVRFDDGSRALYSTDGSNYRQVPLGVAFPRDHDDVKAVARIAAEAGAALLARGAGTIAALRGKRVLVPAIGGRETDFVVDALFGGEIDKTFFAKIEAAPDTASALAALGLGKAEAAIVPDGVDLPAGTQVVLSLPVMSGPVLVVYGNAIAKKTQLAAAAAAFHGDATVVGFKPVDAEAVHAIARRFAPVVKRGPLAVPAFRVLVGDLVVGRTLTIERAPATSFVAAPK